MQVIFGAEGEHVESHSLPLLCGHLWQVAEYHACNKPCTSSRTWHVCMQLFTHCARGEAYNLPI